MNAIGLPGGPAPAGGQYSTLYKKANAHSDSIWAVAWKRQVANKSIVHDVIVSGGVDDSVKVGKLIKILQNIQELCNQFQF